MFSEDSGMIAGALILFGRLNLHCYRKGCMHVSTKCWWWFGLLSCLIKVIISMYVGSTNVEVCSNASSSPVPTVFDRDVKTSAAKVVEWHAKLGEMRLGQLKLTCTVERLQGEKKHLEDMLARTEKAFVKLEQDLVQVTRVRVPP